MLHFFFSSSETAVNNLTVGRESATPCTYWIVRHFSLALHFLVAFGNKAMDVAQWLLFIYLFTKPVFFPFANDLYADLEGKAHHWELAG